MSWLVTTLRKALGIGARKAVEAGVDALQRRADAPAKVKLPPPISDREWRGHGPAYVAPKSGVYERARDEDGTHNEDRATPKDNPRGRR